MKIGLYTTGEVDEQSLAVSLIPKGVEPFEFHSVDEILTSEELGVSIFILVLDQLNFDFIKSVRDRFSDLFFFLIYRPSHFDNQLIEISRLGKIELVEKSGATQELSERIIEVVLRLDLRGDERRAHLRVKPKSVETNQVTIILKEQKHAVLRGKVLDISCGGMAVHMEASLKLGKFYEFVNIYLGGRKIRVTAHVVSHRGEYYGFKFDHVEDSDMKLIAEYIFERINVRKWDVV